MKKYLVYAMITMFFSTVFLTEGCKKDSDDPYVESNMPGVMMTLSSISYAGEDSDIGTIKDSITLLLNDKSLTSGGRWSLSWGPGISTDKDNLVYVAKNINSDITSYTIAIRGTNVHSISNLIEDIDVFTLSGFTYGKQGDSVSKGAMDALNSILSATDPSSGGNLESYLNSIATDSKTPLYITGHSLGGALSTLVTYWLINHDQLKDKFTFSLYTFASPGLVNKAFKDNFNASLPGDASINIKANSLDMVPYGYSNLKGIVSSGIPVHVPLLYKIIINAAADTLQSRGIVYYNIKTADDIGNIPIGSTGPGGITQSDTIQWYDHWLGVEHSSNNYLQLLGATPLN